MPPGEHVDLVHDVHLHAPFHGREVDLVPQVADVVDAAVGGGVISTTSSALPCGSPGNRGQVPSGVKWLCRVPASQFRAIAKILAVDVLPVPADPQRDRRGSRDPG